MKSVKHMNENALSAETLRNVKGGNTTVVLETMVEITTVSATGSTNMLYCDRRRKKVNC